MSYWSVIVTQPQAELKAIEHLKRQGFECYAPRFAETRVRSGRRTENVKFLFPRYLFVYIEDVWRSLLGTLGVSSVLLDGEQPAKVPVQWVDGMKKREDQRGVVVLPRERFRRGQSVEVLNGPYSGNMGIYDGMNAKRREMILLEMFGRWTRVELAAEDLR